MLESERGKKKNVWFLLGKEKGVFSDIWAPWKSMGLYLWSGMTVESSDEETYGCFYEI